MKKKLKNTFIGTALIMAVVTLFSFQAFKQPYKTVATNIRAVKGTGNDYTFYYININA